MSIINKLFSFLFDIISPKKCICCKKEGMFLCRRCFLLQKNFTGFCYVCKKLSPHFYIHKKCFIENRLYCGKNFHDTKIFFDKIIVLTHYDNILIKILIKKFKFQGKREIGKDLSLYLGELLVQNMSLEERSHSIIIPVPLFFLRKMYRGFNQSDIIAKNIGLLFHIPYRNNVIMRTRHTTHQSTLSKDKRLTNLYNAFTINKKLVDNIDKKNIILVDDVVSSGTTLNEISKILKQYGAHKVTGLCLASN